MDNRNMSSHSSFSTSTLGGSSTKFGSVGSSGTNYAHRDHDQSKGLYNRFGFPNPVGITTTTESSLSSSSFLTRRRGEDSKKIYSPSTTNNGNGNRYDGYSSSSGAYGGSQYNNRKGVPSYSSFYDSPFSSSQDKNNYVTSRPYGNSNSFFSNGGSPSSSSSSSNSNNDLLLSHMLDTGSTNGDNQLDIQQRLRIYELLYSNNSALAVKDESRQLAGLILLSAFNYISISLIESYYLF